ncbi:MAG: DUF3108 domain-containing protein [Thermodesulfovibrio sp.]|nr:DUF3108 domain-containing protein [Thermodesulfovibrio sp.]
MFVFAVQHSSAFSVPEILQYNLTWTGIKAGEAILEIRDNGPYVQFISRATSAKWVSLFYHVDDIVVSTVKKGHGENFVGIPHNYRIKIKEGRHRRDKEIQFDHTAKKVTYINHLDREKAEFGIEDSTFDSLSSFYYIRQIPLEVGKSVFVTVFDSKKIYKVEVQVLKKEEVETPLGTFKTILIKPIMKSEGIFYKKGDILIWLTDDEKRIPVLLKTKVVVGSITATLVGGRY